MTLFELQFSVQTAGLKLSWKYFPRFRLIFYCDEKTLLKKNESLFELLTFIQLIMAKDQITSSKITLPFQEDLYSTDDL